MDGIATVQFVGVDPGSFPCKVGTSQHGKSKEQDEVNGEEDFQQGGHFGFLNG